MSNRVAELHSIMPLNNIPSVLKHGILSYELAKKILNASNISVAMQDIQDRRDKVKVPNGLKLHQYANLYFTARNPMMYKRKDIANSLCILQISTKVLNSSIQ